VDGGVPWQLSADKKGTSRIENASIRDFFCFFDADAALGLLFGFLPAQAKRASMGMAMSC
jgi:hypothetical protein